MKVIGLLISIPLSINMFGMDFENFRQKALDNANRLKSASLDIKISQKTSQIMLQYENPSLELERGHFEDENGWRVGISQRFRNPSLGLDIENLSRAKEDKSKADYRFLRASFLKNLEILYTQYVYQKKLKSLIFEELHLASRVENIAKDRLINGIGTKAQLVMVTLEKEDIQNRLVEQKLYINKSYFDLLSLSNIAENIDLDAKFLYKFSQDNKSSRDINPVLLKAKKESEVFEKESKVLDYTIKSIELFGEFEKEPDQEIQRVGISLVVPLFDTNIREAELSQMRATKSKLILKELEIKEQLEIKNLLKSRSNLKKQYTLNQAQQIKLSQLLQLFEDGYKISKGSLLELIDIKNRVIQKRKKLLQIQKELNLKQIKLNFIEGRYND
jgi:cobalt-zinc-cadmium efflux system outer membrane protein